MSKRREDDHNDTKANNEALIAAAQTGDLATIRRIIAEGSVDVASAKSAHAMPALCLTAIEWAAKCQQYDAVLFLFDHIVAGSSSSPSPVCGEGGIRANASLIDAFFGGGVIVTSVGGGAPPPKPASYYALLERLFKQGKAAGDLDTLLGDSDFSRQPVLFMLAARDDVKGVQMLLDAGADPNVLGGTQYTAFQLAARSGPALWGVALALLNSPRFNAKAMVNNIHVKQCPLMHYCVMHCDNTEGAYAVLRRLNELDPAAITTADAKGKLPIDVAAKNKATMEWLKKELQSPPRKTGAAAKKM